MAIARKKREEMTMKKRPFETTTATRMGDKLFQVISSRSRSEGSIPASGVTQEEECDRRRSVGRAANMDAEVEADPGAEAARQRKPDDLEMLRDFQDDGIPRAVFAHVSIGPNSFAQRRAVTQTN
jgi:hypothetical protein